MVYAATGSACCALFWRRASMAFGNQTSYFSRGSCVPRGSVSPQGCCQHLRVLFQWKPSCERSARTRSAGGSGKVIQIHLPTTSARMYYTQTLSPRVRRTICFQPWDRVIVVLTYLLPRHRHSRLVLPTLGIVAPNLLNRNSIERLHILGSFSQAGPRYRRQLRLDRPPIPNTPIS